jgi:hypothetical protein
VALVLAIEPDLRQAEILTRIVREKVKADVVIVDSRDAAMEAMRTAVPDVMLLSALLSPRDEDELVAHLRRLEGAEHLQTHTIPQLASSGGDGHSGPARGLLKAFRRKKDPVQPVSGCDPDLFAQEIRVFLEQAEQKRHERAEDLKYRPAAAAAKAAFAAEAKPVREEPEISVPTTSWDSPFEWRKSDTGPTPLASFEEKQTPHPPSFQPAEEPAGDVDFDWSAHLLEPSSLRRHGVVPEPPAHPVEESTFATDHLLEAHTATSEPQPLEMQSDIPAESHPLEADAVLASEPDALEDHPEIAPEPQGIEAQAAEPVSETVAAAAAPVELTPEPQAFEPQGDEPQHFEPHNELFANERLEAPELFETFVPAPVEELQPEAAADAPRAFDTAAPGEEVVQAAMPAESSIATPEEIEAYGRVEAPAVPPASIMEPSSVLEELFSIECIIDPEPAHHEPAAAVPAAIEVSSADAPLEEEEIDLSWTVESVRLDAVSADAFDAPAETREVEALGSEAVALTFDQSEAERVTADAELSGEPPARRTVNLGPLATWARLERKTDDERRPGSDMREIIERLAVPPHIAGVSYARGVRIRRVRVAGARDRRRPADQAGPVILSRRALAESRSPGATA